MTQTVKKALFIKCVNYPRDNHLERDNTVGYRSPKDLGFPGISLYQTP